ncbi:hypothetical protein O6H91_02G013200 [Diphasiastrum complanatum]|uniref:Uncharacterized protein n=2 Tax=Diphasiastrum complanatum TaxID=34168 RepID=A0ACC2ECX5_DIPCM|nr:hypothetical protein O6H91_02G013200 [Diphasiastrum complanatum]
MRSISFSLYLLPLLPRPFPFSPLAPSVAACPPSHVSVGSPCYCYKWKQIFPINSPNKSRGTYAAAEMSRFRDLMVGIVVILIFSSLLSLWPEPFSRYFSRGASVERQEMAGNDDLPPAIVVYVTVPNKETGKRLATSIITNKLAACVNQIPGVESTYWWEGKVETDAELLLFIKTRQSLLEALTEHIKANHPYEVPEVVSLPITGGYEKYLKWLNDNTAS